MEPLRCGLQNVRHAKCVGVLLESCTRVLDSEGHDPSSDSDRTMERRQSTTTDSSAALGRLSSSSDWAECGRNEAVDAGPGAVIRPGARTRNGTGVKRPARDGEREDFFILSDSLRDQLLAIRRRLWIVNATLESLPQRIEQTYRSRSVIKDAGAAQHRNTSDTLCTERRAFESHKAADWWARWKVARLRSRARRADARATAALYDASVSFGEALEAVLQAAVARVKADEAGFQSLPPSFSAEACTRQ